jgi:hypothetical protein
MFDEQCIVVCGLFSEHHTDAVVIPPVLQVRTRPNKRTQSWVIDAELDTGRMPDLDFPALLSRANASRWPVPSAAQDLVGADSGSPIFDGAPRIE